MVVFEGWSTLTLSEFVEKLYKEKVLDDSDALEEFISKYLRFTADPDAAFIHRIDIKVHDRVPPKPRAEP